ncbi:hypothetical protein J9317_04960 [Metabacillus sp. KIGAM252]|uniref:Uncharacterized protein n=1 Tax=Metabacillus flavus TaxID=2823519 RepID=A0ABS5LCE8_9BACI|nr:DUF5316 family protein [Metabacillus flavus]MBS2968104.1 hypothetical protein [Metabacillus flavus]
MIQFFLIAGIIGIIISGISIGSWTGGQQQRANFFSETKEHRVFRSRIAMFSGLAGVIFLGISGLLWYL